jgi:hypothetical protein
LKTENSLKRDRRHKSDASKTIYLLFFQPTRCPTICVTCVWAGVDSAWEQEKLEARKMLENAAESHTSGARFVG